MIVNHKSGQSTPIYHAAKAEVRRGNIYWRVF